MMSSVKRKTSEKLNTGRCSLDLQTHDSCRRNYSLTTNWCSHACSSFWLRLSVPTQDCHLDAQPVISVISLRANQSLKRLREHREQEHICPAKTRAHNTVLHPMHPASIGLVKVLHTVLMGGSLPSKHTARFRTRSSAATRSNAASFSDSIHR